MHVGGVIAASFTTVHSHTCNYPAAARMLIVGNKSEGQLGGDFLTCGNSPIAN